MRSIVPSNRREKSKKKREIRPFGLFPSYMTVKRNPFMQIESWVALPLQMQRNGEANGYRIVQQTPKVIKTKEGIKALIIACEASCNQKSIERIDIIKELESGRQFLKERYSY